MTLRKIPIHKPPVIRLNPVKSQAKIIPAQSPTVPAADRNLLLRQNNLRGATLKVGLLNESQNIQIGVPPNGVPSSPVLRNLSTPTPIPPADPAKVDAAVFSIKDSLTQSIFHLDVTHGDLQNVQNQFRGLNGAETNAAFNRLSGDDLKNWNQELNGLNSPYSREEKQQLFNELGTKLDGNNASRMFDAMDNQYDKRNFAHAVGQNATPQAKTDFINSQLGKVETDKNSALAVAEVMGGMKNNPAELQGALSSMSPTQLSAVMRCASVENTTTPPDGIPITSIDPSPLAAMIDAVSGIANPDLKASVFENGAFEMKRIGDAGGIFNPTFGNETEGVRNALTSLLNSDTTGVVSSLEANYREGHGLTAYTKEMLDSDQASQLGDIMNKLSRGNNLNEDPTTRFYAKSIGDDGQPFSHNAQVLGYFTGGVLAGAKQITSDTKSQGDIVKNVFSAVTGATGAANPAAGVVSAGLNGLTAATVDSVVEKVSNGTLSLAEGIARLSYPTNPANGKPYDGGEETGYDAAVGRVPDHNPVN